MSEYDKQSPAVRAVIDRKALVMAEDRGITVDQARELIAANVRTPATRPVTKGH